MRRYHAMSEEQRSEVKRKNAQCQRNWMQKNEGQGDLRGLKTAIECAAAGDSGREKTRDGRRGVEGLTKSKIREAGGIDSASRMAMVGRGIGASLSPTVVALGLG